MPTINVQEVKEKILAFLNEKGPSLPIPVSKVTNLSAMYASAILSELLNEKRVKISHMRIGNSPLYYTPETEPRLEEFAITNLRGVEKEAFDKLKENKILIDTEESPVTRVALQHIKDFAIPLNFENIKIWKYFILSDFDARDLFNKLKIRADNVVQEIDRKVIERPHAPQIKNMQDVSQSLWTDIEKAKSKEDIRDKIDIIAKEIEEKQILLEEERQELLQKELIIRKWRTEETPGTTPATQEVVEIKKEQEKEIITPRTETIPANIPQSHKKVRKIKPDSKFLSEIKHSLETKSIELIEIKEEKKKEIIAIVKIEQKEFLLVAFDQKKITEKELLKAYKKSLAFKLPYYILNKGDSPKKLKELSEAYKNLSSIEKI